MFSFSNFANSYDSSEGVPNQNKNALVIAANGVGDTYFDFKEIMESQGWTVTTAGVGEDVDSCRNKPQRDITVDLKISDINPSMYDDYDCIFIPSGGHWQTLYRYSIAHELINNAYKSGVVISAICVGIKILGKTQIVSGAEIAFYTLAYSDIKNAGGTMVHESVVSSKGIVTGGTGGGPTGGGASVAPTEELCNAIVEESNSWEGVLFLPSEISLIVTILSIIGICAGAAVVVVFVYFKKIKK